MMGVSELDFMKDAVDRVINFEQACRLYELCITENPDIGSEQERAILTRIDNMGGRDINALAEYLDDKWTIEKTN